jgi:AcrR family transcriptional regulator
MKKRSAARPGGRSSRIKEAVFDAVEALMAENPNAIPSIGEVAARAAVNPTSLYRRWGDATVLAAEVAVERLTTDFPIPDTGSLRGDLLGWATNAIRRNLKGKKNLALLRILSTTVQSDDATRARRLNTIMRRGQELQALLERAKARGEPTPYLSDVLEIVLAPIYLRALFFSPMDDVDDVARLVDRLLAIAPKQPAEKRSRADKARQA